jgi:dTDP-4-dehydrorhamnose reductase
VIIVTGAAGLLGGNLVLALVDAGQDVVSAYRSHPFRPPAVRAVSLDLTDEQAVRQLFEAVPVRAVVHCAAAANVDWCEQHPAEAFRANVVATQCVVNAARHVGARFIYVSTDSVYGGDSGLHTENEEPLPANVYARTKLEGEDVVRRLLGDASLIVRITVFGWNAQNKQSLSEWILMRLRRGETVPGFTDMRFSPISANLVAKTIAELLQLGASGTLNVGGSVPVSKFDFAVQVADVFGHDKLLVQEARMSEASLVAPRPHDSTMDIAKLLGVLGHSIPRLEDDLGEQKQLLENGFVERLKGCATGELNGHA